jgi:hypothetical protein
MAHKKRHGPPPVPPANRPAAGPPGDVNATAEGARGAGGGAPLQEHDPKRRVGGFEGAGEHPRQQPSSLNDGQQHSR